MRFIYVLIMSLVAQFAWAGGDYAREKKWADEVLPGIVVGDAVYLQQKNGHKFLSLFTETQNAKIGVVVIHGIGIHPDWNMVGTLRSQLAEQGFTTLSIQMPILANDAKSEAYQPLFPEAHERIDIAVEYLRSRGYQKVAIVSHSLGSAMSWGYVKKHQQKLVGWASLGIGQGLVYKGIEIPVLDLYGEKDLPPVVKKAADRAKSLKGKAHSLQVKVPQGDHFFNGHETEMVDAVKNFLDALK